MSSKIKVLIIDGHDRRALASVRSLGSKSSYNVFVGSERKMNASRYSKYCDAFFIYENPDNSIDKFINDINDILHCNSIDVLIPMDDRLASYVSKYKYKFNEATKILIPEWSVFNIAFDKSLTLREAEAIKIPVPKEYSISEALELNIDSYPLIIKPTITNASIGMNIINNKEGLKKIYDQTLKSFDNVLIQEVIPKDGGHYQANMIFDKNSNLVCSTVKNKIREYPLTGGPSTFFKTANYPLIEEYAEKLLKQIKWVGPAEVEFMVNPKTNEPVLMEINPRMSATIVLSIKEGIDFPKHIVDCALDYNKVYNLRNKKFDVYCQWLIPGDLLNFLTNKRRFSEKPGYFLTRGIKKHHMTWDIKDMKPFWVNVLIIGISSFNPNKIKRFIFRR